MQKNNSDNKKWICLEITHRYNKSQHVKTVKNFLLNIFSKQQILFLGSSLDEQNFNNVMDGYFFIQCNDISPYLQTLRNSKYINNILITFDQIQYINNEEVQDMVKNYQYQYNSKKNTLIFGDIIKVKKGMFKNLYGIVNEIKNQHQVIVVFKFISGYRFQVIDIDNCEKQNNFFQIIRVSL